MRLSRQDVRLAARTLAKHPGFATIAILSLSLAIALNTTMYSVLDALVNPKVELRSPDHLYNIGYVGDPARRLIRGSVEQTLRSGMRSYEVTGYGRFDITLVEHGWLSNEAFVVMVRPDLFTVLGAVPSSGRVFGFADTTADTPSAMISDRIAMKIFPGGASPVGQSILIGGKAYGVIGVVNRASQVPGTFPGDVWILPPPGAMAGVPLNVLRRRDGVSAEALDGELRVLAARLAANAGESPKDTRFDYRPLVARQFTYHRFHLALVAAVAAVLLVACANLANLQIARGISRARELALRSALGASRGDIIAHLLVETGLLTVAGLVLGVVLTLWGTHALTAAIPESVGRYIVAPQTSWRMFAVAIGASVICMLLVGLVPAIRVSRVDPAELIKAGAGTGANKRNRQRYGLLVAAEIGLSLTLLSGAALVMRQAWRVDQEKFGFDPKPLAKAWLYRTAPAGTVIRVDAASAELVARARAVPGVVDATAYQMHTVFNNSITITDPGRGAVEIPTPMYRYHIVSPSYFRTFGLPITKGRDFFEGARDVPEVIIDRRTAKFLFPNSDPIGSMVKFGEFKSALAWVKVIGVVGEADGYSRLSTSEREGPANVGARFRIGDVYLLATARDSLVVGKTGYVIEVVARARSNAERLPLTLARALRPVPGIRRLSVGSMEESLGITSVRSSHNFVAAMFGLFAALAIAMASLGIYGIVAHSVAERRRELGVRIAFGATTSNILNVVLREGNAIALAGIALGLLFTKYDASWLSAFIGEEDEYSAVLFAAMALVLFAVTVGAALIPAFRATRVDPVEALRSE